MDFVSHDPNATDILSPSRLFLTDKFGTSHVMQALIRRIRRNIKVYFEFQRPKATRQIDLIIGAC